jgi:omega-6 fatty acid desaturase (delta-12 desaturase)
MVLSLEISYWLTLALAIPAAGFLIRIFIICHDCGHGSFLRSRRANDVVGFVSGALAFMPYYYWSHRHAIHHATAGNLEKRGIGDVWTLTLQEYREGSFWLRLRFRLIRNPLIMMILGPFYMFLIFNRLAHLTAGWRWHRSVQLTNLCIAVLVTAVAALIGFKAYLLIQFPVIMMAGIWGVWLFYVQHQFEDAYWENQEGWDYFHAALEGSSHYKLPRVLQWFSGNIGFHHLHHLSPRIPNYALEACHRAFPMPERVKTITFMESLRCLQLRVWDRDRRIMVKLGAF